MYPMIDWNPTTSARRRTGWVASWLLLVLNGGCNEQDMVIPAESEAVPGKRVLRRRSVVAPLVGRDDRARPAPR